MKRFVGIALSIVFLVSLLICSTGTTALADDPDDGISVEIVIVGDDPDVEVDVDGDNPDIFINGQDIEDLQDTVNYYGDGWTYPMVRYKIYPWYMEAKELLPMTMNAVAKLIIATEGQQSELYVNSVRLTNHWDRLDSQQYTLSDIDDDVFVLEQKEEHLNSLFNNHIVHLTAELDESHSTISEDIASLNQKYTNLSASYEALQGDYTHTVRQLKYLYWAVMGLAAITLALIGVLFVRTRARW